MSLITSTIETIILKFANNSKTEVKLKIQTNLSERIKTFSYKDWIFS